METGKKVCPIEYGLSILGGKWKMILICLLGEEHPVRYSDLKKHISEITDRMLTQSLKEMVRDPLVDRIPFGEKAPQKVEYQLTAYGEAVLPILYQLADWVDLYARENKVHRKCGECKLKEEDVCKH